ncbi:MAG: PIN/TRAM domain-containing protein [Phycisphaerales bacterium]|nr:PIN/TRAM domain-containing protein [Phycisphaerales bacterium]
MGQAPKPRSRHDVLQKQRANVVRFLRAFAFLLMMLISAVTIVTLSDPTQPEHGIFVQGDARITPVWIGLLLSVTVFFALIVAVDILTPRRKLSTLSAIFFGCVAGLLLAFLIGYVIDYLRVVYNVDPIYHRLLFTAKVVIGVAMCYLASATILQTQDDFRLVIPYVEFAKQIRGSKPLILDSSALIDGRAPDIAETGVFQTALIIPRFVLDELQTLADSSDKLKRSRGRRGLDMVARLQRSARLDVTIDDTPVPGLGTDQMLVELAQSLPAVIVTTDSALEQVAAIRGVETLNLHTLAAAVRPRLLPGENIRLALAKRGEQHGQAVGYLEDGTMVVVDGGAALIGEEIDAVVTSSVQTAAGRLVFARPAGPEVGAPTPESAPAEPQGDSPGFPEGKAALTAQSPAAASPQPSRASPAGERRALRNPRRG